jgi:hypothetical protein
MSDRQKHAPMRGGGRGVVKQAALSMMAAS